MGKTFTAILAARKLIKERNQNLKVIVVVPWISLKNQWEQELKKHNVFEHSEVLVINTAYKNSYSCDLLILDEIHGYAADEFKKVFKTISYKYIFGLTATIERADGKEDVLLEKCPVIDNVHLDECLENGWISDYVIYNLGVDFTPKEKIDYDKTNSTFKYAASRISYGGKQSFDLATKWIKDGTKEQKALAAMYYNAMRKRKTLCTNATNKLTTTVDIINRFPDRKTIVFSENIDFAESVKKKLPNVTEVFHSKMKKKEKELAMKNFTDKRTKKRVVSSVKALSAGIDIPDISLGIVASGNSSKLTQIQQIGRTVRALPDKLAVFINLYVRGTQDYNWLVRRQDTLNVKWVEFLDEIPQ